MGCHEFAPAFEVVGEFAGGASVEGGRVDAGAQLGGRHAVEGGGVAAVGVVGCAVGLAGVGDGGEGVAVGAGDAEGVGVVAFGGRERRFDGGHECGEFLCGGVARRAGDP